MEFFLMAILVVLAAFFCWDVAERIYSIIAILRDHPDFVLGNLRHGNLIVSVLAIILLCLGVFGIFERNIGWFIVASISYLVGGFGESAQYSISKNFKFAEDTTTSMEIRAIQEHAKRKGTFLFRVIFRYIVPIILGYTWFIFQA